jgi:hypothetical protein
MHPGTSKHELRSPAGVRNVVALLLLMWAVFEGGLLGLLAAGRRMNLWEYRPISTRSLTPEQKDILQRMLAGEGFLREDAELGWTNRPGGASRDGLYHLNDQGIRAARHAAREIPPGKIRLTSYGDSFTFGAFVRDDETWQAQLEAAHPGIEALNLGVNGYGPDQAFLRYERTAGELDANVVVIGFMSENIGRVVSRFRPFYIPLEELICSKPRYLLGESGELTLLPNPLRSADDYRRLLSAPGDVLPALAEHDYWAEIRSRDSVLDVLPSVRVAKILLYHLRHRTHPDNLFDADDTYRVASPAYRILVKVLEKFYEAVEARGQAPIVLIYPRLEDASATRPSYAPLLSFLESKSMRHVEVLPELMEKVGRSHVSDLYFDGHLNARGNGIVATLMARSLHEFGLDGPVTGAPPGPAAR